MTARNRPFTRDPTCLSGFLCSRCCCRPPPARNGANWSASGAADRDWSDGTDHLAARPERRARQHPHRGADSGGDRNVRSARCKFFIDGQLLRTDERRRALRRRVDRREPVRAARDCRGRFRRAGPRGPRLRGARTLRDHRGDRRHERAWSKRRSRTRTDVSSRRSRRARSACWRTACRRSLDLARHEAVGATLALLIDSSSSMSRRLDFVQRTAATLRRLHDALGPDGRRAILQGTAADDRTDRRQENGRGGDRVRFGRRAEPPSWIRWRRSRAACPNRRGAGR